VHAQPTVATKGMIRRRSSYHLSGGTAAEHRGGTWTQQGPKLVGTGNAGKGLQGRSVALSADGNTALVGGFGDNSLTGAAWVFTRSDGTWAQQGLKLVGTGGSAPTQQGRSVALSPPSWAG
jgi:hypothetical protein